MKEKQVGFWTFYKALNFGPFSIANRQVATVLGAMLLFWGLAFVGGEGEPIVRTFALFGMISIRIMTDATRVRPSIFNLMPIGRKRKAAFFFLAIPLTTLIGVVAVFVALVIFGLILALIVLITSGEWIIVAEETENAFASCWQGELFSALLGIGVVGAAMLVSCCQKKSVRQLLTLVIPVVTVAPLVAIMKLGGLGNGSLFVCFDALPYSYIYLIVFGVIAAALFAAGVVRLIGFLTPKDDRVPAER